MPYANAQFANAQVCKCSGKCPTHAPVNAEELCGLFLRTPEELEERPNWTPPASGLRATPGWDRETPPHRLCPGAGFDKHLILMGAVSLGRLLKEMSLSFVLL